MEDPQCWWPCSDCRQWTEAEKGTLQMESMPLQQVNNTKTKVMLSSVKSCITETSSTSENPMHSVTSFLGKNSILCINCYHWTYEICSNNPGIVLNLTLYLLLLTRHEWPYEWCRCCYHELPLALYSPLVKTTIPNS